MYGGGVNLIFMREGILSTRFPRAKWTSIGAEGGALALQKWIPCILLHPQANERLTAQKISRENASAASCSMSSQFICTHRTKVHGPP